MTNAVQSRLLQEVIVKSPPTVADPVSLNRYLNLRPAHPAHRGQVRQDPYSKTTPMLSDISQLNPDTPLPISLSAVIVVPLLLYLLYMRFNMHYTNLHLKRNHQTAMHTQREHYENEVTNFLQRIEQLKAHINRLRTEQILREKQALQLRNRLEQREKLLDRFTAELLPAAMNTSELSTLAKNLQQACRTAELSARFDNKLLQRLPPSFERVLTQLNTGLSDEDIRLAGYLYLDLPNKEIAQLRNISAAGVSKSRNRLRKKLGLKPEQDLTVFMRSLTDGHPDQDIDQLAEQILGVNHNGPEWSRERPTEPTPILSYKKNASIPSHQHKSAA